MTALVVAILLVLIFTQFVTWYGLWFVAKWLDGAIRRQDDRNRKRAGRVTHDEDQEYLESLAELLRNSPEGLQNEVGEVVLKAKSAEEFDY